MPWWAQNMYQPPPDPMNPDPNDHDRLPTWLNQVYGQYAGIAQLLFATQRLREEEDRGRLAQTYRRAGMTTQLAQGRVARIGGLTALKNQASQFIIAAQDAIAQQQRELDAMRARAQSPSLTNIALGPQAGRGVSTPTLRAPNLAAQAQGLTAIPSLAALGTVPGLPMAGQGQGQGQVTPVTAWWTWPGAGGASMPMGSASAGTGGSATMGSTAGNPAAGLWSWGGVGGAPANLPGQNVSVGMTWGGGNVSGGAPANLPGQNGLARMVWVDGVSGGAPANLPGQNGLVRQVWDVGNR